ncbi:MAG TPA: Gfo/Idh/MocA family oxidoreductase [Isosphaeraceae bacterium]|jgi:predicted dehydrogenase|nr:Gfo/Idh/MocA family oxidoreductase [Isosphaeraceae bacterium]
MSQRKLRVGMVGGGGPANFFGAPHRRAILIDNSAELTAGALRSKPAESIASAKELFMPRGYPDWQTMIKTEAAKPESERIDYITIVTPNDAHFGPADAAAAAGIGVLCEKPLTTTLDEARRLQASVRAKNVPFVVAYTYTGFPMVMLARELVRGGEIGEIRKVEAWYPQGWLATKLEADNQKQASWRVDPTKAGGSGCGGDIGTHAYEFVRFAAGLSAVRLRARLKTFVPGRALDDDFTVLAELNNGGIATITASQVTVGVQNDNGFRVVGTTGTIEWNITEHNVLKHYVGGQPLKLYRLGAEYGYFPASIKPYIRVPSGHPEGFHEALANLHRTLEWTIRAGWGESVPKPFEHPGIDDGVAGMAFIEAAVASSKRDGEWVSITGG